MSGNENGRVVNETERSMENMNIEVTKISDGLGFGDGPISGKTLRESVGAEVVARTEAFIESPNILVAVDKDSEGNLIDDDGCGDGRVVIRIFQGLVEKNTSKLRQKVFGGSAASATAIEIGSGQAADESLQNIFSRSIGKLKMAGIKFGAHTADHVANHKDCGCGALDKAPESILAVGKNVEKVYDTLSVFGYSREDAEPVVQNFVDYSQGLVGQDYSGRTVVDEVIDEGMVVKQLGGPHREFGLVVSDVEGYTADQQGVRDISDDTLQIFVVDMPRIRRIARDYTKNSSDPKAYDRAVISQLVFTLGVAGVLTTGDQKVWYVQDQNQMANA